MEDLRSSSRECAEDKFDKVRQVFRILTILFFFFFLIPAYFFLILFFSSPENQGTTLVGQGVRRITVGTGGESREKVKQRGKSW